MKSWRYAVRLALPAGLAAAWYAASTQTTGLRPFSVQMHLHASMSEGSGSMRGANVNAQKLGLNVLWFSDHDWRIAYHTYPSGFDFESDGLEASIPMPVLPGTDPKAVEGRKITISLEAAGGNGRVTDTVARISKARAAQGTRSFEIGARKDGAAPAAPPGGGRKKGGKGAGIRTGEFEPFFYTIAATRQTMKRSLASQVELSLAVYPELDDDRGGMAALRIDLSQQPPGMAAGTIFYVWTAAPEAELKKLESDTVRFVRLPYERGKWNRAAIHLTDDARRLGLGGEDNSMVAESFGVLTRGKPARAFFDDFRISHKFQSEPLRDQARRMAAALQKEYHVINYVGQELSYGAHLNPLGLNVPMIDYAKNPFGLDAKQSADFVHAHGGIVSLNHIFGTSRPPKGLDPEDPKSVRAFEDRRIQELSESDCYGADLLEVGYPVRVLPMASFLRVWDAIAAKGVYVLGNGTSDTHTSTGGWFDGNNFVTWVWARSVSMEDLIDGFRGGNTYFGDPARFKGSLTLTTGDGHRMGQVVITQKPRHTVRLTIQGLPEGASIVPVTGGKAGGKLSAGAGNFDGTFPVETASPTFFRAEVYLADGRPLVFSNPIHFAKNDARAPGARKVVCR